VTIKNPCFKKSILDQRTFLEKIEENEENPANLKSGLLIMQWQKPFPKTVCVGQKSEVKPENFDLFGYFEISLP
jgi:hypothetical protein